MLALRCLSDPRAGVESLVSVLLGRGGLFPREDRMGSQFESWASAQMRRRLVSFARRFVKDAHEAEDIVQEVLLRAEEGQSGLRTEERAENWLFRICRHAAIDHVRARKVRRGVWGSMPEEIDDWAMSAGQRPGQRPLRVPPVVERGRRLSLGLTGVPAHQRLLLELYYGRGLGHATLSRLSGLSASALRLRLYRARQMLAQQPLGWRSPGPGQWPPREG